MIKDFLLMISIPTTILMIIYLIEIFSDNKNKFTKRMLDKLINAKNREARKKIYASVSIIDAKYLKKLFQDYKNKRFNCVNEWMEDNDLEEINLK